MEVVKFGGTSVGSAVAINNVLNILKNKTNKTLAVVSAFSSVTNALVEINLLINQSIDVDDNIREIKNRHIVMATELGVIDSVLDMIEGKISELKFYQENYHNSNSDAILAVGELLSSFIICKFLQKNGLKIAFLDSREVVKTDSNWGEANINEDYSNYLINIKVKELFLENDYVICGGFISSNGNNITTTLGRGGSDFSAAVFAASLNAQTLEIWTDVNGILTCDPRMTPNAKKILCLSYLEAAELAFFGAKVLHPKTILPAIDKKIPVFVRNTFVPNDKGTLIMNSENNPQIIKSIAFKRGITVITVHSNRMLGAYGFLSKVFEIFNKYKTSVDLVTTSEVSVSMTILEIKNLTNIVEDLQDFGLITTSQDNSSISLIGEGITHVSGIAAKVFGALKGINVSMVSVGASEVNLSMVVRDNELEAAVKALHTEFFETESYPEVFETI